MYDLLALGLTVGRWLTGRVACQTIEDVEKSNPASFTEYLRSWLQKDIDRISTKLESQSHGKICSALHYVKRALCLMEQDIIVVSKFQVFPKSYALPGVQNYLRDADKWATESFFDKANVSAKWRLEALNIQLFCSLLLHLNQPDAVLRIWKEILDELISDKELVHSVLSKSWLFAPNPEVKSGVLELVSNVRSALTGTDCKCAPLIYAVWQILLNPRLESSEFQSDWYHSCFHTVNSYRLVDNSCVLITVPYHQFCLLPQNFVVTIVPGERDDETALRVLDNDVILKQCNLPKDDPLSYCTVAYDEKRDAILVVQRKSILMFDKQLNSLGCFESDLNICDNKQILCSKRGVWVLCNETNQKLYVRWYCTGEACWSNVPLLMPDNSKYSVTLMDIRDLGELNSAEVLIRVTENLMPRFFIVMCRNNGVFEQTEIVVENFNLFHLDEQSLVWMTFHEFSTETFLLIWSDGDQNVSLVKVNKNGKHLEEHFVSLPVPYGLRHVIVKSPYIFCGVIPYACSNADYSNYVKKLNH